MTTTTITRPRYYQAHMLAPVARTTDPRADRAAIVQAENDRVLGYRAPRPFVGRAKVGV